MPLARQDSEKLFQSQRAVSSVSSLVRSKSMAGVREKSTDVAGKPRPKMASSALPSSSPRITGSSSSSANTKAVENSKAAESNNLATAREEVGVDVRESLSEMEERLNRIQIEVKRQSAWMGTKDQVLERWTQVLLGNQQAQTDATGELERIRHDLEAQSESMRLQLQEGLKEQNDHWIQVRKDLGAQSEHIRLDCEHMMNERLLEHSRRYSTERGSELGKLRQELSGQLGQVRKSWEAESERGAKLAKEVQEVQKEIQDAQEQIKKLPAMRKEIGSARSEAAVGLRALTENQCELKILREDVYSLTSENDASLSAVVESLQRERSERQSLCSHVDEEFNLHRSGEAHVKRDVEALHDALDERCSINLQEVMLESIRHKDAQLQLEQSISREEEMRVAELVRVREHFEGEGDLLRQSMNKARDDFQNLLEEWKGEFQKKLDQKDVEHNRLLCKIEEKLDQKDEEYSRILGDVAKKEREVRSMVDRQKEVVLQVEAAILEGPSQEVIKQQLESMHDKICSECKLQSKSILETAQTALRGLETLQGRIRSECEEQTKESLSKVQDAIDVANRLKNRLENANQSLKSELKAETINSLALLRSEFQCNIDSLSCKIQSECQKDVAGQVASCHATLQVLREKVTGELSQLRSEIRSINVEAITSQSVKQMQEEWRPLQEAAADAQEASWAAVESLKKETADRCQKVRDDLGRECELRAGLAEVEARRIAQVLIGELQEKNEQRFATSQEAICKLQEQTERQQQQMLGELDVGIKKMVGDVTDAHRKNLAVSVGELELRIGQEVERFKELQKAMADQEFVQRMVDQEAARRERSLGMLETSLRELRQNFGAQREQHLETRNATDALKEQFQKLQAQEVESTASAVALKEEFQALQAKEFSALKEDFQKLQAKEVTSMATVHEESQNLRAACMTTLDNLKSRMDANLEDSLKSIRNEAKEIARNVENVRQHAYNHAQAVEHRTLEKLEAVEHRALDKLEVLDKRLAREAETSPGERNALPEAFCEEFRQQMLGQIRKAVAHEAAQRTLTFSDLQVRMDQVQQQRSGDADALREMIKELLAIEIESAAKEQVNLCQSLQNDFAETLQEAQETLMKRVEEVARKAESLHESLHSVNDDQGDLQENQPRDPNSSGGEDAGRCTKSSGRAKPALEGDVQKSGRGRPIPGPKSSTRKPGPFKQEPLSSPTRGRKTHEEELALKNKELELKNTQLVAAVKKIERNSDKAIEEERRAREEHDRNNNAAVGEIRAELELVRAHLKRNQESMKESRIIATEERVEEVIEREEQSGPSQEPLQVEHTVTAMCTPTMNTVGAPTFSPTSRGIPTSVPSGLSRTVVVPAPPVRSPTSSLSPGPQNRTILGLHHGGSGSLSNSANGSPGAPQGKLFPYVALASPAGSPPQPVGHARVYAPPVSERASPNGAPVSHSPSPSLSTASSGTTFGVNSRIRVSSPSPGPPINRTTTKTRKVTRTMMVEGIDPNDYTDLGDGNLPIDQGQLALGQGRPSIGNGQ